MPSNVQIATFVFFCLVGMFGYVYNQKKQFYPTVVYLSKSGAAIAVCYAEALLLGLIVSTILRKIFFGDLRPIESERLTERSWYALTETCLAFTIFKEETVPVFVFLFALLIFMKTFHWLTDERVDLIERSMTLSKLFHVRIIAVFILLGGIDATFITQAYQRTINRGPSIQIVFGFEYCILLIMLLDNCIKYIMYLHSLFEYSTSESRAVTQMYVAVVMSSIKVILYSAFFLLMVQIFTFPLFVLRPMYFTLKAFKKSVMDVLMTRRALRYLNNFYPDATPLDLETHDNACIICREELTLASKKLPCNHIFHTACLRAWFQRQQTCPTCRFSILKVPTIVQLERLRTIRRVNASTQTEPILSGHRCHYTLLEGTRNPPAEYLQNLTENDLANIENEKREELRRRIQTLSMVSSMLDTASRAIQQLPRGNERAPRVVPRQKPETQQNGGESRQTLQQNLKVIRAKRMQSLLKSQQGEGNSNS
uniref:RING-type E3 ubiquitin transferase n=1 Tax=Lygus hesperus TaxID=30085 RepID=A0A0A9W5W1_LYGHE